MRTLTDGAPRWRRRLRAVLATMGLAWGGACDLQDDTESCAAELMQPTSVSPEDAYDAAGVDWEGAFYEMVWQPPSQGAPLPAGDAWVAFPPGEAPVYGLLTPIVGIGDPTVVPASIVFSTVDRTIAFSTPDQARAPFWDSAPPCAEWPFPSEFSNFLTDDEIAMFRGSFEIGASGSDAFLGTDLADYYRSLVGEDLGGVTPDSWEGVLVLVYALPGKWVYVQLAPKFGVDLGGESLWVSLELALVGTGHVREIP